MGLFHWIGSRVSGQPRAVAEGRVRDDKPADEVV